MCGNTLEKIKIQQSITTNQQIQALANYTRKLRYLTSLFSNFSNFLFILTCFRKIFLSGANVTLDDNVVASLITKNQDSVEEFSRYVPLAMTIYQSKVVFP